LANEKQSAAMPSGIRAHVYEVRPRKDRRFTVAASSILILCIFCLTTVDAVAEAAHKTEAELTEALIGTWELVPSLCVFFGKTFLVFNKHGTIRTIGIGNRRGDPGRGETHTTWRVTNGVSVVEKADQKYWFQLHDQILSIDNGLALLSGNRGKLEMHRISHLPALPPLMTSSEVSAAINKARTISAPQPDYPLAARQNRTQGSGIFRLLLTKDGQVHSIQVIKSTGSKLLDDAAEKALRLWRFKPGVMQDVQILINFVLGRSRTR
jgi:TonB family protein